MGGQQLHPDRGRVPARGAEAAEQAAASPPRDRRETAADRTARANRTMSSAENVKCAERRPSSRRSGRRGTDWPTFPRAGTDIRRRRLRPSGAGARAVPPWAARRACRTSPSCSGSGRFRPAGWPLRIGTAPARSEAGSSIRALSSHRHPATASVSPGFTGRSHLSVLDPRRAHAGRIRAACLRRTSAC